MCRTVLSNNSFFLDELDSKSIRKISTNIISLYDIFIGISRNMKAHELLTTLPHANDLKQKTLTKKKDHNKRATKKGITKIWSTRSYQN